MITFTACTLEDIQLLTAEVNNAIALTYMPSLHTWIITNSDGSEETKSGSDIIATSSDGSVYTWTLTFPDTSYAPKTVTVADTSTVTSSTCRGSDGILTFHTTGSYVKRATVTVCDP